ncbi:MAG: putative polymerase sigma factor SigI [Paenibacillaceae bacterium]|nr:putative polymerase sigma factor SigI [Paenibacillaceae bacterium]
MKSGQRADNVAAAPDQVVMQIQAGDLRLRNQFITDYQPYVAKITSRFCKRYIDPACDDEFSIALGAFNEAINQYVPEKGRSFLGFAETVVRRRLIDYVRKQQKFNKQTPYSSFEVEDEEDNVANPVEIQQAMDHYAEQQGVEERRAEIAEFSRELAEFSLRFGDLADNSPKHHDSRQALFQIARQLSDHPGMMTILRTKRTLPIKEMLTVCGVSRKTLERNRKFIIAVALIFHGSYPYLRDYLQIIDPIDQSERKEQSP